MGSRWALNLVFAMILLLLGWAIRQELTVARIQPTLAGTGTAEPHLIEIAREGEPTMLLERLASGWRMRTPWDIDADPDRVAALLTIREAPILRSVPVQAAALDELGLEPVNLRLRLDTTDFAIGGLDPIAQWRYLASDDLVHLIPDRFHHLLIAPPIEYVARTPLPRDPEPVFAALGGVPLSRESLTRLTPLVAERLEALTGDIAGTALELSAMDGTRIRYLVSEDGRRWSRPDVTLTYMLATAPELVTEPGAFDPTPPGTRPRVDPTAAAAIAPGSPEWPMQDADGVDWSPGSADTSDAPDASASLMDPEAPLSGDLPLGPPPTILLRPHEETRDPVTEPGGFGAAMHREPPEGFGLDPFAPDPDVP